MKKCFSPKKTTIELIKHLIDYNLEKISEIRIEDPTIIG